MRLVKLICTSCGAPLEFPDEFQSIQCAHCASTFLLEQYKGVYSLRKIERSLEKIEQHTERASNSSEYLALRARKSELAARLAARETELKTLPVGSASIPTIDVFVLVLIVPIAIAFGLVGGWPLIIIGLFVVVILYMAVKGLRKPSAVSQESLIRQELKAEIAKLKKELWHVSQAAERLSPK